MARKSRGLSQEKLAKGLGISKSYLSLLEAGKRTMTLERVVELAVELNLNPLELVEKMLEGSPRRGKRYIPAIAEAVRDI